MVKFNHNKSEPQIAVLLPVYNPDDELVLTLNSLRAQEVPFRLFLIDDGSAVKADYEKLTYAIDVKIIRLAKNLGISGAMNAGIVEILKGDFKYIARIDAGDICAVTRFEKQLKYLDTHPEIDILGSSVEFQQHDDQNQIVSERIVQYPDTPEGCVKRLYSNMAVSHPAIMVRREVFDVLRTYSESYPAAEDYDLMWRATKHGFKLANLSEPLLVKIENPSSISQKYRRKQIFSRLRIQWSNCTALNTRSIMGMLKTLFVLVAPKQVVTALKSIIG
jgi:glycosyltransferase involved in cell wall biosynthesis